MTGLYEDIDEDLDEMDDEGDDEGSDDESLAERRRRRNRNRPRGGGYNQPRVDNSKPVTQTQLSAALARVGADIKKVAAGMSSIEKRSDRTRKEGQQFAQMAMLMPLLLKPKTIAVSDLGKAENKDAKVQVESNDSLSLLLPLMMMGGMGGGYGASGSSSGGGNNDMMMMMMLLLATGGLGGSKK
jgi:hypothetical protein